MSRNDAIVEGVVPKTFYYDVTYLPIGLQARLFPHSDRNQIYYYCQSIIVPKYRSHPRPSVLFPQHGPECKL